jgi:uroporphyrinogen decarboxylase
LEFGKGNVANKTLTHSERLKACIAGEKLDHIPVALWRHFPVDDQTPEGLAAATIAFQNQFDFDLIKVSPASSFCIKDWGATDAWRGDPEGTRDYTNQVIKNPEDWSNLPILDPLKGHLGKQLSCLKYLIPEFSPKTPVIQTIFNPLAQAKNLVGKDRLEVHIRQYPEAVQEGLERITQSTIRFVEEAIKTGIDGIFFAVQHAQYGLFTTSEYETFGIPYDLRILEVAKNLWLNMLHLHGEDVMFDLVSDYPVAVINWHDRHTKPSLAEARDKYKGVLCGGLRRQETMVLGTPKQVKEEAIDAIQATGGQKFILGTGCVLPVIAPYGNIIAAQKAVLEY